MLKIFLGVILALCIMLPATADAKSQNLTIDGDHGKLAAVLQTPDNKSSYPLVIICHGFTSSKEHDLLKNLADDLESRGIASIRFDFNGHGASEGDFQQMTVLNEIEDAKCVYAYARDLKGVTSVSIAGHSQGGVVASMVAGQLGADRIKALALMAPAAVLRDDAIRGNIFTGHYDSINPPEYVELKMQDRTLKLGRDYIKTAQTLPIYETAQRFHGKAFMIHGTGDIVVPYTYSLRYQDIFPGSKVELLKDFNHSFTQDTKATAKSVADFFASQLK